MKPTLRLGLDEPPELPPVFDGTVFEDEKARRTRRTHLAFKIGFFASLVCMLYLVLVEENGRFDWGEYCTQIPLILLVSTLLGGYFAFLVAMLLTLRSKVGPRGANIMRRMRKASEADAPAPAEGGAAARLNREGHFTDPAGVPPKDSQT